MNLGAEPAQGHPRQDVSHSNSDGLTDGEDADLTSRAFLLYETSIISDGRCSATDNDFLMHASQAPHGARLSQSSVRPARRLHSAANVGSRPSSQLSVSGLGTGAPSTSSQHTKASDDEPTRPAHSPAAPQTLHVPSSASEPSSLASSDGEITSHSAIKRASEGAGLMTGREDLQENDSTPYYTNRPGRQPAHRAVAAQSSEEAADAHSACTAQTSEETVASYRADSIASASYQLSPVHVEVLLQYYLDHGGVHSRTVASAIRDVGLTLPPSFPLEEYFHHDINTSPPGARYLSLASTLCTPTTATGGGRAPHAGEPIDPNTLLSPPRWLDLVASLILVNSEQERAERAQLARAQVQQHLQARIDRVAGQPPLSGGQRAGTLPQTPPRTQASRTSLSSTSGPAEVERTVEQQQQHQQQQHSCSSALPSPPSIASPFVEHRTSAGPDEDITPALATDGEPATWCAETVAVAAGQTPHSARDCGNEPVGGPLAAKFLPPPQGTPQSNRYEYQHTPFVPHAQQQQQQQQQQASSRTTPLLPTATRQLNFLSDHQHGADAAAADGATAREEFLAFHHDTLTLLFVRCGARWRPAPDSTAGSATARRELVLTMADWDGSWRQRLRVQEARTSDRAEKGPRHPATIPPLPVLQDATAQLMTLCGAGEPEADWTAAQRPPAPTTVAFADFVDALMRELGPTQEDAAAFVAAAGQAGPKELSGFAFFFSRTEAAQSTQSPAVALARPPSLCMCVAAVDPASVGRLAGMPTVRYLRSIGLVRAAVAFYVRELKAHLRGLDDASPAAGTVPGQESLPCSTSASPVAAGERAVTSFPHTTDSPAATVAQPVVARPLRRGRARTAAAATPHYAYPTASGADEVSLSAAARAKARRLVDHLRRRTIPTNRYECYVRAEADGESPEETAALRSMLEELIPASGAGSPLKRRGVDPSGAVAAAVAPDTTNTENYACAATSEDGDHSSMSSDGLPNLRELLLASPQSSRPLSASLRALNTSGVAPSGADRLDGRPAIDLHRLGGVPGRPPGRAEQRAAVERLSRPSCDVRAYSIAASTRARPLAASRGATSAFPPLPVTLLAARQRTRPASLPSAPTGRIISADERRAPPSAALAAARALQPSHWALPSLPPPPPPRRRRSASAYTRPSVRSGYPRASATRTTESASPAPVPPSPRGQPVSGECTHLHAVPRPPPLDFSWVSSKAEPSANLSSPPRRMSGSGAALRSSPVADRPRRRRRAATRASSAGTASNIGRQGTPALPIPAGATAQKRTPQRRPSRPARPVVAEAAPRREAPPADGRRIPPARAAGLAEPLAVGSPMAVVAPETDGHAPSFPPSSGANDAGQAPPRTLTAPTQPTPAPAKGPVRTPRSSLTTSSSSSSSSWSAPSASPLRRSRSTSASSSSIVSSDSDRGAEAAREEQRLPDRVSGARRRLPHGPRRRSGVGAHGTDDDEHTAPFTAFDTPNARGEDAAPGSLARAARPPSTTRDLASLLASFSSSLLSSRVPVATATVVREVAGMHVSVDADQPSTLLGSPYDDPDSADQVDVSGPLARLGSEREEAGESVGHRTNRLRHSLQLEDRLSGSVHHRPPSRSDRSAAEEMRQRQPAPLRASMLLLLQDDAQEDMSPNGECVSVNAPVDVRAAQPAKIAPSPSHTPSQAVDRTSANTREEEPVPRYAVDTASSLTKSTSRSSSASSRSSSSSSSITKSIYAHRHAGAQEAAAVSCAPTRPVSSSFPGRPPLSPATPRSSTPWSRGA